MATTPAAGANARNSINAQIARLEASLNYLQKNLGRLRVLNDVFGGPQERGGAGETIADRPTPTDHLARLTDVITGLESTVRAIDEELAILNATAGGTPQPSALAPGRG